MGYLHTGAGRLKASPTPSINSEPLEKNSVDSQGVDGTTSRGSPGGLFDFDFDFDFESRGWHNRVRSQTMLQPPPPSR